MNTRERVIVGMSGGVDSSVTAALMKDQGHQVSGLFMKNWEEDDKGECNSKNDYNDAKRVCKKLNIKLFSINFSDIYWDLVFKKFLSKLKSGITPNPDILCNKEIKFNYFLKYGLSFKLTSFKGIWPGYTFPLLPFRVSQSPSINVVPFTDKDFSFAEIA